MTPEELAQEAIRVIQHPVSDNLILKLPGKWGQFDHCFLAGPNSPKGTIIQSFVGYVVVNFDPVDVLAWCVARSEGRIKVFYPYQNKESES